MDAESATERVTTSHNEAPCAVPVGALLNHLPKFNGANVLLEDWKERLESAVRLCNVAQHLKTELALSTLEGDARRTVMLQPARHRQTYEQIVSLLEDVYGDVTSEAVLRKKFFARLQKEDETLAQYANALQELMGVLQKREEQHAASFTNAELVVRDQFILGLKNQPLRRTLRERLKLEPQLTLHRILSEAIILEKEELTETVTVAAHVETVPSKQSNIEARMTSLEEAMKGILAALNCQKELPVTQASNHQPPRPMRRPTSWRSRSTGQRCWTCHQEGHRARDCPCQGPTVYPEDLN